MKETVKKDLEFIKNEFQTIVAFEKAWMKRADLKEVPVAKVIHYFGTENICAIFGCTVTTEMIAVELVKEAFK